MIGSKILLVVLVIAISDNVVGQFTQNSPANSMTAAQQAKLMSMIRARNTPQQQTGMNPLMMYLMMQSGQPMWMMMLLMNPNVDTSRILPYILMNQGS
ncbi:Hypothetical predicted protein [Mytilus galloprovincialis]|uniref:Uncharacterized protein n=1 Tax=Mytilus galloprovincialis TaxID=29158 RepID=A0A8B6DM03_MYTGA|nr:Hypothetical predicted protein [Mytilus galloprovincialis]